MKLTIRKQRFPSHDGRRPLSYAIYYGRTFLCYAWSFSRAWVALQIIREGMEREA